jgi:exopolysaccharide biosynthesis protein
MPVSRRTLVYAAVIAWLVACAPRSEAPQSWLGTSTPVAAGVDLFRTADASLVENAGPIAVYLLRLDPKVVTLASALANNKVAETELVSGIAARRGAIAAINGGYFNRANGEPAGLLKVAGELVSDSSLAKGVVVIHAAVGQPVRLAFDQLAGKVAMTCEVGQTSWLIPIDGVDTTRARGKVMLYTSAYGSDTGTAPTGTEWVLSEDPLRVTAVRPAAGHTPIPARGAVLSFGGTTLPDALTALVPDVRVTFATTWKSVNGLSSADLDEAHHIVNGAGLLRREGRVVTDWRVEGLSVEAFTDARHPRTLIGVDTRGFIWLAAIDGRQPDSIGMRFSDLQRLADRLELTDALNLDGGGSTTMVVRGQVVNRPSDPAGPRAVADAILVLPN